MVQMDESRIELASCREELKQAMAKYVRSYVRYRELAEMEGVDD